MSWSPIHIVQQFQDLGADRPARIVLVGAAATCARAGRIRVWRWTGGRLPDAAVQARVYEAVTGVVDLENTLMIGERFGIWPAECYTVEVELPPETFGTMVMAEAEARPGPALRAEIGFDPGAAADRLASRAAGLAIRGDAARAVAAKGARDLAPVASFHRTRVTGTKTRRHS
ncbi:hypothetical protein GE300_16830 [Rhodobacteraceae bacterium 2CG4]|uniref:Uncharacterized protein n=2 Tax=Halovulum marinum TaxID=2662447 RepID=A0A6L5Z3X3_9RHOB|nr:hypothetical protein [Halovulum marinum]